MAMNAVSVMRGSASLTQKFPGRLGSNLLLSMGVAMLVSEDSAERPHHGDLQRASIVGISQLAGSWRIIPPFAAANQSAQETRHGKEKENQRTEIEQRFVSTN
jgi:hypothetical protein